MQNKINLQCIFIKREDVKTVKWKIYVTLQICISAEIELHSENLSLFVPGHQPNMWNEEIILIIRTPSIRDPDLKSDIFPEGSFFLSLPCPPPPLSLSHTHTHTHTHTTKVIERMTEQALFHHVHHDSHCNLQSRVTEHNIYLCCVLLPQAEEETCPG